jgi:hypothetical protein
MIVNGLLRPDMNIGKEGNFRRRFFRERKPFDRQNVWFYQKNVGDYAGNN